MDNAERDFISGATYFQQSSGADEMAEALGKLLTHNADLLRTVKNHGAFADTWLNGIESAHHDAIAALAKYNSFIKTEEDGKSGL